MMRKSCFLNSWEIWRLFWASLHQQSFRQLKLCRPEKLCRACMHGDTHGSRHGDQTNCNMFSYQLVVSSQVGWRLYHSLPTSTTESSFLKLMYLAHKLFKVTRPALSRASCSDVFGAHDPEVTRPRVQSSLAHNLKDSTTLDKCKFLETISLPSFEKSRRPPKIQFDDDEKKWLPTKKLCTGKTGMGDDHDFLSHFPSTTSDNLFWRTLPCMHPDKTKNFATFFVVHLLSLLRSVGVWIMNSLPTPVELLQPMSLAYNLKSHVHHPVELLETDVFGAGGCSTFLKPSLANDLKHWISTHGNFWMLGRICIHGCEYQTFVSLLGKGKGELPPWVNLHHVFVLYTWSGSLCLMQGILECKHSGRLASPVQC